MAEGAKGAFSTMFKGILGLGLLVLGVWAIIGWWQDLLAVVRGCLGLFLVLAAVIVLVIAKE